VVALVAAGGLLAGMVIGSTPGARTAVARALVALPAPLRPDAGVLAGPAVVLPAASLPTAAPATPAPPGRTPATSTTPEFRSTPTPTATPGATPTGTPGEPAPPTPQDAAATPCAPTATACVDLSANRSWLLRDGQVTYGPVPITHGRPGFRTPPGTFRVESKRRDHVSSIYDAEMPWSVFFNGGVAFHEGSLAVTSHGCVHLSRAAAETYFSTLSVGDIVQVVP
jgi:lipoprotein-anchoring transpeptidase ErfK/SrfK